MYSLYGYTKDIFYKSIENVFPEIDRAAYGLCFLFSQNSLSDFCTPVARQICRYIDNRQTPEKTAAQIIGSINSDTTWLHNFSASDNGFINCCISSSFFDSLLTVEYSDQTPPVRNDSVDLREYFQLILKLERLLDHAIKTAKYVLDSAPADSSVLCCAEERKLLSILALEDFPFFRNGESLFMRKLLYTADQMYRKIPIICKDEYLSTMRLRLVRAVMRRVEKACILNRIQA